MVENKTNQVYRSDDSWVVDDDGVQYDTSKFHRNGNFLDVNRTNGERGFIRISCAMASMVTHHRDDYTYYPQHGELREDGDYFIMEDKYDENPGEPTRVVVAIPSALVSRPAYAYDKDVSYVIAAQRHLREAFHHIDDAQLKMKRAHPDQRMALATVQKNLQTVLCSIEDRRNPSRQWELDTSFEDLIEADGLAKCNHIDITGRPDLNAFDPHMWDDTQGE